MAKTIKVFLSELNQDSSHNGSFWAMAAPCPKEVDETSSVLVQGVVQQVFEEQCSDRKKIPSGVYISVLDENDNKIFGGHITKEGEITLFPIIEIMEK